MATLLPQTTFVPASRRPGPYDTHDGNQTTRTQHSLGLGGNLLSAPVRRGLPSPVPSDDGPTPKASHFAREVTSDEEFDDLYDVTEDEETVDVPLFVSASIKRARDRRCPSVVIPSPSAWPTIENLKKEGRLPDFPFSPPLMSPSPKRLSKLKTSNIPAPSSLAPSLDGSITSEELSNLSCPSTPDTSGQRNAETAEGQWGVRLHPQAMQTLRGIAAGESEYEGKSPAAARAEMREADLVAIPRSPCIILTPVDTEGPEPISAISVPSPGGFFSSLDANSRNTWCMPAAEPGPNTGTAEAFYGVPWRHSSAAASPCVERIVELDDNVTDGPPSAIRLPLPTPTAPPKPEPVADQVSIKSSGPTKLPSQTADYDEKYRESLQITGKATFDRTALWLSAQETYISDLVESESVTESTSTPTTVASPTPVSASTPCKSVRFADEPEDSVIDKPLPAVPTDSTFVEGFKHYRESTSEDDVFVQRKARIEALKLDRSWLAKAHRDQLQGRFEADSPTKPKSTRPVSDFYAVEDPTERSQMIDRAQNERKALEQIKPVAWNLEATKMLNGGTLVTSPAGRTLFSAEDARVLDLGGQASCDWAWEVALQYPHTTVYTVYTKDQAPNSKIEGPENHKHQDVPNLWTLPFRSNHFDIISARSLFALLKTNKPNGSVDDEYDLCLQECFRCLKPGGYLEFALLDADILQPGCKAQALSVEFGFNLKTRGYDPAPTKNFLPRLKRAGFGQMRRAWLALPMARSSEEGSTADASCISGMVGAWAWEKWLLKLQLEMGKDEDKLLEGVAAAIEEGGETGAAWRYLSGWARKGKKH